MTERSATGTAREGLQGIHSAADWFSTVVSAAVALTIEKFVLAVGYGTVMPTAWLTMRVMEHPWLALGCVVAFFLGRESFHRGWIQ